MFVIVILWLYCLLGEAFEVLPYVSKISNLENIKGIAPIFVITKTHVSRFNMVLLDEALLKLCL